MFWGTTRQCRQTTTHALTSPSTPYTLHPTPYTLHPTPYTLHPTHPTPYKPYTLHTLHPTHPTHPTPCTPYTLHPAHPTLYTLHTLHPTPYTREPEAGASDGAGARSENSLPWLSGTSPYKVVPSSLNSENWRGRVGRAVCDALRLIESASERIGSVFNDSKTVTWKPRPEPGRDSLLCATFAG